MPIHRSSRQPTSRPSKHALLAARERGLKDVIAPELAVLFCGINPGLYSAAVGHHFARPGNRFWPALSAAGFTPRQFAPAEESELLALGFGLTNIVNRASARAGELSIEELLKGSYTLVRKARRWRPRVVAILGVDAYRKAFLRPKATIGRQPETLGPAVIWVLPSPSGLNAHYQPRELVRLLGDLRSSIRSS